MARHAVWQLLALFILARAGTLSCLPLSKTSAEHRESTAQILELEDELKRQAGEDKSPVSGNNSPLQALPQIDGLASEETKQEQTLALARLMTQQQLPEDDVSLAQSDALTQDVSSKEGAGEETAVLESMLQAGHKEDSDSDIKQPSIEEGGKNQENEAHHIKAVDEGDDTSVSKISPDAEDVENLSSSDGKSYDDAFYDTLIESMRQNPSLWDSVLGGAASPETAKPYNDIAEQLYRQPSYPYKQGEYNVKQQYALPGYASMQDDESLSY